MVAPWQTEEYLQSRIEWVWKCRERIIEHMETEKEKLEYKQKIQDILDKNLSSYDEGDYKIEYCQYCHLPLKKDSVAYQHGHCGYSCL